ncbi:MAG: acyl-CoA dehydrogenase family protein [Spirochaetota bacterium]|nr:acyl-CoA dehydrogenase family protein [Spirochaetota bacterium]
MRHIGKYGGGGFDFLSAVLAVEYIARTCAALALSFVTHIILCTDTLFRHSNEEQRMKYLPRLCSGENIGALAITEPNAGSDATGIQLSAVKKGNGYVLNGTKMFITNGPIADIFVVYAKTDKSKKAKGITAFIVERDFGGFSVSKHLEKIGHRGSPTSEIVFEDCFVPEENLLGEYNQGVAVMMSGLDRERTAIAGIPLGIAQNSLDLSVKYASEREQYGQPIGNFQFIQGKLADMFTKVEASRLLIYKAASIANKRPKGGKGTVIHKYAASALLFAGEVATQASMDALQIHGGYGYTLEYPVNRLFREGKLWDIAAGTAEMRRIIIARELLMEV